MKEILNDAEKRYLGALIKPFRDKVEYICKYEDMFAHDWEEYIVISFKNDDYDTIALPNFEEGTMYKGMEEGKLYTLKELGL